MHSTQRCYRLLEVSGSVVLWLWGLMPPALAQIRADETLPTPSAVTSTADRTVIRGGTQRGTNLFHSFRQFSVPRGSTAAFQVDRSVRNVFSRVTGATASRINGRLQVLQDDNRLSPANFFLLNPNGILFGPDASLNVGGSFLATTAERIDFADGTQFSATAAQTDPLLTVQVPVGLQFGARPGSIVNRARADVLDGQDNPQLDSTGESLQGLNVPAEHTLALIGGDIVLSRGRLMVEGGRIELGSMAPRGRVGLTSVAEGWALRYDGSQQFGVIYMNRAILAANGTSGGAIQIQGEQIRLRNTQIFSTTTGGQSGRPLSLNATDAVIVRGVSSLRTETYGIGTAGSVNLSTRQLTIQNSSQIGSATDSAGQGGTVRIAASDAITLGGGTLGIALGRLTNETFSHREDAGASGNIDIRTNRLHILPGGLISSTTFGTGDAGDVHIQANQITFAGTAPSYFNNEPVEASSGIFAGTVPGSRGNGGAINIATQRLSLSDGALVQASTYGSGNAGNVVIRAAESVEVVGTSASGQRSGILATSGGVPNASFLVNRAATGRGGGVTITTNALRIQDRAVVAVSSLNSAAPSAGTLKVEAQTVSLDDRAELNAQTESAGANIDLSQMEVLLLRRQSRIFTDAGSNSGSGTGGNIHINSDFVIAAPAENSDISADAVDEAAGDVRLNANVLGIAPQERETPRSDITASSERGASGEIVIGQLQTDPTQGLVALPSTVFDASQFIAQRCAAGGGTATRPLNSFVVTGRGGLPPSPVDIRSSDAVLSAWATVESERGYSEQAPSRAIEQATLTPIVEAQGWIKTADGKVELVNQAPAISGFRSGCS